MARFTDAKGREWEIALTLREMAQIARESPQTSAASDFLLQPKWDMIASALWIAVRRDAEQRRVGRDDFLAALSGEALAEAHQALVEELCHFFPAHTIDGAALRAAKETMTQIAEAAAATARSAIDDLQASSKSSSDATSGAASSA